MFFKKHRSNDTPMEQFLHRDELNVDERAILDIYLTGVSHALTGINAVHTASNKDPIFIKSVGHPALEALELEEILAKFLVQRPDMKRFALGLVAVTAVLARFKA